MIHFKVRYPAMSSTPHSLPAPKPSAVPQSTPHANTKEVQAIARPADRAKVFGNERTLQQPTPNLPPGLPLNTRLCMDGLDLLAKIPAKTSPVVFFDPQYRGIMDKLRYGNEGVSRGKARCSLPQMDETTITAFIQASARVLIPSGHLFLWLDKFHLCTGFTQWLADTSLEVVDMVVWDKERMGMGYRTRRTAEFLLVLQKRPKRAKGVWQVHNIRDVWAEKVCATTHAHPKPVGLQATLIEAVSLPNDIVIDPAAGSFSVLEACQRTQRNFLGGDING